MQRVRVLFIDSNPVFLRLATRVLQQYHGDEVDVVGTVNGYQEALALELDTLPHVVLLGLGSSSVCGLAIIPQLKRLLPEARVIVLGLVDVEGYDTLARSVGSDAFVLKASMSINLLPAIRQVAGVYGSEMPGG
jgi:DNA-binding NarL/FixJ family response regulator